MSLPFGSGVVGMVFFGLEQDYQACEVGDWRQLDGCDGRTDEWEAMITITPQTSIRPPFS